MISRTLETDSQLFSTILTTRPAAIVPQKLECEMLSSKVKPELPQAAPVVSIAVPDTPPAANDESVPAVVNDLRNPLWIIAIGMAWFFGITAAVIAAS